MRWDGVNTRYDALLILSWHMIRVLKHTYLLNKPTLKLKKVSHLTLHPSLFEVFAIYVPLVPPVGRSWLLWHRIVMYIHPSIIFNCSCGNVLIPIYITVLNRGCTQTSRNESWYNSVLKNAVNVFGSVSNCIYWQAVLMTTTS